MEKSPPRQKDLSVDLLYLRMSLIPQLTNQTIFLVDGDNFPDIANMLLEEFKDNMHAPICCIAFIGMEANFKSFPIAKAVFPWFHYVRAQTPCKDAADHVFGACATMINEFCPPDCSVCLVTRDGFVREVLATMLMMNPRRKIMLTPPIVVRSFLENLKAGKEPDIQIPLPQLLLPKKAPLPQKNLPNFGYVCKHCQKEGGQPDSHWHNKCPMRMTSKSDQPAQILGNPLSDQNDTFTQIVRLVYETYLKAGQETVRLSLFGILLREHCLLSEKNKLKIIVTMFERTELGYREGIEGNSSLVFHKKKIAKFLKIKITDIDIKDKVDAVQD